MVTNTLGIQGIQIIGLLFCIVMLYFSFLHYKRREYNVEVFLFWILVWIGLTIMVVYPTSLDFFVRGLKFGRRLDFFIVFGFLFLTTLVYYNYLVVNKTKRKIEKIVRKLAIRDHKKQ
jgi:hypothetical protein